LAAGAPPFPPAIKVDCRKNAAKRQIMGKNGLIGKIKTSQSEVLILIGTI
jgi:hypothetical protein